MANMDITGATVTVSRDFFSCGKDEFGQDLEAECYSVMVTREDGFRMVHQRVWYGAETKKNEDGFRFLKDVRLEALANAECLVQRVKDAGMVDDSNWLTADPVYGSDYYCKVHNF